MIAVFTKSEREFKDNFTFYPSGKFIRIRSTEDVSGRLFDAVVEYVGWGLSKDRLFDAYDVLKERQPELFI